VRTRFPGSWWAAREQRLGLSFRVPSGLPSARALRSGGNNAAIDAASPIRGGPPALHYSAAAAISTGALGTSPDDLAERRRVPNLSHLRLHPRPQ